jgi:DNA end-binding protein Ku
MRALWSGSLSFGLINIPVRLYSAAFSRALNFKLIDKHGNCPISYVKVCRANHKEVPYEDIVRGYEYQKGDYVVLDEKDFKKAAPKKSGAIDVLQFSKATDIDTKYYEKPYYIEPDKKSAKAYTLLVDALRESGKVAVASFIMKDKEHIAVIKPEDNILILNQLRYQDEIRKADFDIENGKYTKSEMEMALALINKLTKKFDPKKYHDTYTEKLEKIIEAKAKGKRIKVAGKSEAPVDTNMNDLIKMLKQSLNEKETEHKKASAR